MSGETGAATARRVRIKTPWYVARRRWRTMIRRCTVPTSKDYKWYGGRGVSVCDRWLASFEDYLADVGYLPAPGLTLDRIDNDKGYEPSNVRWATWPEQRANQRDGMRAKTHCPADHPYDDANTHIDTRGYRVCRECKRVIGAQSKARALLRRAS